jgi:single-stranded DNA-binding protein
MNYCCFIAKIINEPISSQFDDNIPLVELSAKFPIVRKTKTINTFRVLVWGNLAEDILKYYRVNDYIIIEGYIRNFSEPGTPDQVEISARKVYPFLLKNQENILY